MQRGPQTESVDVAVDVEMGDRLENMIHDLGQECFKLAHALMYDTWESDLKKLLYPGCMKSWTLFSMVFSLVNMKARYGWSDKSFTSLLKVMQGMLPEENKLPKSYYGAKKILCPMSMEY